MESLGVRELLSSLRNEAEEASRGQNVPTSISTPGSDIDRGNEAFRSANASPAEHSPVTEASGAGIPSGAAMHSSHEVGMDAISFQRAKVTDYSTTSNAMHFISAANTDNTDSLMEDLLHGLVEGHSLRHVQETCKMIFKVMYGVVRTHADSVKTVNRIVSEKANINYVNQCVGEMQKSLDRKAERDEVEEGLKMKASKHEVKDLVPPPQPAPDLQGLINLKADIMDVNLVMEQERRTYQKSFEQHRMEVERRLQKVEESMVNVQMELRTMQSALEGKLDRKSFLEELDTKANNTELVDIRMDHEGLKENRASVNKSLSQVRQCMSEMQDSISLLSDAIDKKANKEIVAKAMETKATVADLEILAETKADKADIKEVQRELSTKITIEDVDHAIKNKADSRMVTDLVESRVQEAVGQCMNAQEESKKHFHDEIIRVDSEITGVKAATEKSTGNCVRRDEFIEGLNSRVTSESQDLRNSVAALKHELETRINSKADLTELNVVASRKADTAYVEEGLSRKPDSVAFNDLKMTVSGKVDVEAFNSALATKVNTREMLEKLNSHDFLEFKQEVQDGLMKVRHSLEKKATTEDVHHIANSLPGFKDIKDVMEAVNLRMTAENAEAQFGKKADLSTVQAIEDALSIRIAEMENIFEMKADRSELKLKTDYEDFKKLKKDIKTKANAVDTCTVVDVKRIVEDINRALTHINRDMKTKATLADLPTAEVTELQSQMNKQISKTGALPMCGRWVWKSMRLRACHAVPWNEQLFNAAPHVFHWERDHSDIVVSEGGIYELSIGFFASKKPSAQVLVNGQVVLSLVNSVAYSVHHASSRIHSSKKENNSQHSTGLTAVDFIQLRPNSRLSVTYTGEMNIEGFLELRRL